MRRVSAVQFQCAFSLCSAWMIPCLARHTQQEALLMKLVRYADKAHTIGQGRASSRVGLGAPDPFLLRCYMAHDLAIVFATLPKFAPSLG
jgi:hypothetical protein